MRTQLDNIDIRLLNALQANNQAKATALAEIVPLSASAIIRRLQRLRSEGVIAQDVAVLDRNFADRRLSAVIQIQLDRHRASETRAFHLALVAEPAVQLCVEVTGEFDVVLIVMVRCMEDFNALIDKLLGGNTIVRRYETNFVRKRLKTSLAVPLDHDDST